MQNILVNNYVLKDPKINIDKTIVNISDVHSNVEVLKEVVEILKKIKLDYIFMPGDIFDSINNPYNYEIIKLLEKLGNISETYLSLGNREMCEIIYENGKKKEIETNEYIKYFKNLFDSKNFIPLISEFVSTDLSDDMTVSALNFPLSYYEKKEDADKYKNILEKNITNLNNEKFNLLLLHSPNFIIKNNKIDMSFDIINNMNLILCGHNHGGLIPAFMQDIIGSHRGLAGPYENLFQPNAYGIYNEKDTSVLISSGVTKISATSESRKIGKFLNKIYIPEIDLIHMEEGNKHTLNLTNRVIHNI